MSWIISVSDTDSHNTRAPDGSVAQPAAHAGALRPAVVLGVLVVLVSTVWLRAPSAGSGPDPSAADLVSPVEVAALFDRPLPAVGDTTALLAITGDEEVDRRLRELAEARGYRRRGSALGELGVIDGRRLHRGAIDDFEAMREALRAEAGVELTITSGHRDVSRQRELFLARLRSQSIAHHGRVLTPSELALGVGDDAIEATLRTAALPGYSKHHTGYALDLASGSFYESAFRDSRAWEWLVADGYANAMRHGWIPSYPDGAPGLGPDAEPWEWVWVGRDLAACARVRDCPTGSLDRFDAEMAYVTGWSLDASNEPSRRLALEVDGSVALIAIDSARVNRFDVAVARSLDRPDVGFADDIVAPEDPAWACVLAGWGEDRWVRIGCREPD